MFQKLTLIILLITFGNHAFAQNSEIITDPFYVNVFVNADKTIYIETEKTSLENVNKKVSKIIRNRSFEIDQLTIYRIFADKSLKMGYLIDIDQKLLAAHNEKVRIERYLLNTVELNIDGENWFKSIDLKNLERID